MIRVISKLLYMVQYCLLLLYFMISISSKMEGM